MPVPFYFWQRNPFAGKFFLTKLKDGHIFEEYCFSLMPGKDYYKLKIDRMVRAALEEKEAVFVEIHQNDSDSELLQYFFACFEKIGHAPRRREFIGWTLIEERFGSVENAARRMNIPKSKGLKPIGECELITEERERQKKIYREQRLKKQLLSDRRVAEQEKRREKELIWLAENDPDKLSRMVRKASKKTRKYYQQVLKNHLGGKMKYYLSTIADVTEESSNNKWEKLVYLDKTASIAAANGLGIELAEFGITENMDSKFEEVLPHVLKNAEASPDKTLLAPYNEIFPMAIDPLISEIAYKRYEQSLEYCRRFGATKMIVHSNYIEDLYYSEWFVNRNIDFWNRFLDEHDDDVVICMKNVYEEDPDLILNILRAVDNPRLRMCLDVGYANLTQMTPLDWLKKCDSYISHYHIHNNFGKVKEDGERTIGMHLALGDGTIDMKSFLTLAEELTPDATAAIECNDLEASVSWLKTNGFLR